MERALRYMVHSLLVAGSVAAVLAVTAASSSAEVVTPGQLTQAG